MKRRFLTVLVLVFLLVLFAGGFWWYQERLPSTRFQHGKAALAQGDLSRAERWAASLESTGDTDLARLLRAESLFLQQKYSPALAQLNQITDEGPLRLGAALLSGRCLLQLKAFVEAKRVFSYVLTQSPEQVDALRGMAAAAFDLGQLSEALRYLAEVGRLDERDGKSHRLRGLILKSLTNFIDAETALRTALEKELPPTLRSQVRSELADVLLQLNRPNDALEVLQAEDQRLSERTVTFQAVLADALYRTGQNTEAMQVITEALSDDPRQARLWLLRGQLLRGHKDHEAVQALQRAVDLNPGEYEPRYQLSLALAATGDQQGSQQQLEQANRLKKAMEELTSLTQEADGRPWDADLRLRLAKLCDEIYRPDLAALWRVAARECQTLQETKP